MIEELLAGCTDRQRAAVLHQDGPLLVLAGPGSGKTRVITHRIARLIASGVEPRRILALTFTNKAAGEMRDRLSALGVAPGATLCTFHSLCVRLLREFADRAGLSRNFSIYDRADGTAVLAEILKERGLDPGEISPARALRQIGVLKNHLLDPEEAAARRLVDLPPALLDGLAADYRKRLETSGALDFDDLLTRTARLLESDSELRDRLGRRYGYILVDEYQDTNACQYRIARALSLGHRNLFVTGDPDQSIYGWRGADIGIILAFERDFPGAPVVRLEENFRSSPQVLRLADDIIKANIRRREKSLIARKPAGAPPRLYRYNDEREEARGAAAWIRTLRETEGIEFRRMAVFYRTNAMSRVLEEALIEAAVPYRIVKGVEFFHRREVKDLLAYLRLLLNPADEVSLARIVNRPARGIGGTTLARLTAHARETGTDLGTALRGAAGIPGIAPAAASRVAVFLALMVSLRSRPDRPVAPIVREVYERSGLRAAFAAAKEREAADNIEELIHSAMQFDAGDLSGDGLAGYLLQTALISDIDAYDEKAGAVSLMTLHSAKGLEFEAVLIAGLEDGIIPHALSREEGRDSEEERRLLFVGITRAERFLALSHALSRTVRGATRRTSLSPFLRNLSDLEIVFAPFHQGVFYGGRAPSKVSSGPVSAASPPPGAIDGPGFREGMRIRHPALGPGRIESFVAGSPEGRAVIQFDRGARLVMIPAAARLEPEK